MDKRTKVKLRIVLIVILLVGIIVTPVVCIITHWVEKNIVTDIEDYETYFGAQGIHRTSNTSKLKKTSESYLVINNIFPEKLPKIFIMSIIIPGTHAISVIWCIAAM